MKKIFSFTALICGLITFSQNFSLNNHVFKPGTSEHAIFKSKNNLDIPIIVINGKKQGSVLGIITESQNGFSPFFAIQQFITDLNPSDLSGTLIFINTFNHKDIPDKIINTLDYVSVMHSNQQYEDILPYAKFYMGKDLNLSGKSRDFAENTFLPYALVTDKKYKIPFVEIEFNNQTLDEQKNIDLIKNILEKLLISLQIKEGVVPIKNTLIIEKHETLFSNVSGIFYSDFKSGTYVKKGDVLGYISDSFGNKIQEIHAPSAGIILRKIGISLVKKNEALFTLGVIYM